MDVDCAWHQVPGVGQTVEGAEQSASCWCNEGTTVAMLCSLRRGLPVSLSNTSMAGSD